VTAWSLFAPQKDAFRDRRPAWPTAAVINKSADSLISPRAARSRIGARVGRTHDTPLVCVAQAAEAVVKNRPFYAA